MVFLVEFCLVVLKLAHGSGLSDILEPKIHAQAAAAVSSPGVRFR